MTLSEIEKLAKEFSDSRESLKEKMGTLEGEIAAAKKKYLPGIRKAVEAAANKHMALFDAISEAPELFKKPKTVIFHGIRLGYMKGKGEIVWEDSSKVVALIKKHFPDDWESMVKITETPIKAALGQLAAAELKKLGITVTDTGDEVVIKPTDSEIDKMINALLKEDMMDEG